MIRFNFIPRLGLFKKYLDPKTEAENILNVHQSSPETEIMTFYQFFNHLWAKDSIENQKFLDKFLSHRLSGRLTYDEDLVYLNSVILPA